MDFRKVIKFGENSYVISLPNKWVRDNKIKKGDLINLEYDNDAIKIIPYSIKKEKDSTSEKIIDFDKLKTFRDLKTHITAAYINGYDQIVILGKNVNKEQTKIRELIKSFIALEIIEQTNQKTVLKEFVNTNEVILGDIIRRIDRTIISMAEDCENHLQNKGDFIEVLRQKDEDIFKFHNFVFHTIKSMLKSGSLNHKLTIAEVLYLWELVVFLEKIGDQLKRIPRNINTKVHPAIIDIYQEIIQYYKDTMKTNYTKDTNSAIELINRRKQIFNKIEENSKYLKKTGDLMIEKMKNISNNITHLSKVLIKFTY